uniref:NAD(P)-dependent oxidoreductase n=2 Tax=Hirondellea gigas TaxID=1518452 RepID=A0A6A7GBZ6_9CRUS
MANVAWIGLGAMGFQMAGRLSRFPCVVYNRATSIAKEHSTKFGTVFAPSIQTLCKSSPSMIFTCLPTSKEVENVINEIMCHKELLQKDTLFVDCTSGEPADTRKIGKILESSGFSMVDAPISGGPHGAKAGTLSMMVGGSRSDFDRLKSVATAISANQVYCGPLSSGHAVKAINNIMNSTHLMVAAEGLAALTKMGIDPAAALRVINASSGRSLQTEQRLPKAVLSRKFDYNFKLGLMNKDINIANRIMDDYFPEALLMRTTQVLSNNAVKEMGYDADYTEMVRYVEKVANVIIQSPLDTDSKSSTSAKDSVEQTVAAETSQQKSRSPSPPFLREKTSAEQQQTP